MMAHSMGVELEARMEGGLLKGLKRGILRGESLFVSTYTAPAEGGGVDAAPKRPGDIKILEVDGTHSWVIERTRNQQQPVAWISTEIGSRE